MPRWRQDSCYFRLRGCFFCFLGPQGHREPQVEQQGKKTDACVLVFGQYTQCLIHVSNVWNALAGQAFCRVEEQLLAAWRRKNDRPKIYTSDL